jgi:hypothetical protein
MVEVGLACSAGLRAPAPEAAATCAIELLALAPLQLQLPMNIIQAGLSWLKGQLPYQTGAGTGNGDGAPSAGKRQTLHQFRRGLWIAPVASRVAGCAETSFEMENPLLPLEPIVALNELRSEEALKHPQDMALTTIVEVNS